MDFKTRFRIPEIVEWYAATEGNVLLFNMDGKPGRWGACRDGWSASCRPRWSASTSKRDPGARS
jgi:hypothetical protein